MAPTTIRKALGAVKDQTSIGLARVSSNIAPELDVAIVKATSHDDEPADEKYVREILRLTSYSRAYVGACVSTVSRRLGKTRDWIVAMKALILVHRLLVDGDPVFQVEIVHTTRRGTRLLNMSDFRDEAHSNSWDLSAFVRSYALYLDQRLELNLYESKQGETGGRNGENRSYGGNSRDSYGDRDHDSYRRSYSNNDLYGSGNGGFERRYSYSSTPPPAIGYGGDYGGQNGSDDRHRSEVAKKAVTPAREMKPERALGRMRHLQRLLDRFLACRPTGKAKNSRMVFVALYPIVRESFQLYADICEMLAVLLDRFFNMEYQDCAKAFESYASAAKQIDELIGFYAWCKDVGVARSSEYPEVQRITDKLLETLEEFLRDKGRRPKSPDRAPVEDAEAAPPVEEVEPVDDMNGIKALPAPEDFEEKSVSSPEKELDDDKKPQQEMGDLLDLRDETVTADDQGNRLALALFSGPTTASGSDDSGVTSAWQNPAAEPGKADWELALVETASNLSKQKATLGGGFDPILLDGMYDSGVVKQHVNLQITGGSASSVALPLPGLGRNATPVLALPAPDGTVQTINQDPFAASLTVPPPSYVQMAELEKKQQFLDQEQQLWHQYARDGMQGQVSLNKLSMGYNYVPQAMPYTYGMPPPVHGAGYYHAPY